MTIDIKTLIEKRPHLKDPLEFYARWQRFQQEAAELLPKKESSSSPLDSQAYPRENARSVFQLFVSIFDLPAGELEPLAQALENGEIDFMRLPLEDFPDLPLPYAKEELTAILFLLSRPYFLALRETFPLDGSEWESGHCPLCSARPALASIVEGPRRHLHCSWCGTAGPHRLYIGCPNCGAKNEAKLRTLVPEEEPGFRVAACDECRTYVKVVENSILSEMSIDLADLASLPLDIVAQEKGYVRTTPNPIGMKKME
ncbi:MAG: formate dehydrogenase accessory protein FdhE [Desulfobulbaceae bacterium]|nr:formate dehydrogenase accessory protein FdhE [Desulfobulbaceae bacterium]